MTSLGRRVARILAAAGTASAFALSSVALAPPAQAAVSCSTALARHPSYLPDGWRLVCTNSLPSGYLGVTYVGTRTIKIRSSQSNPLATLAHESAHAYSYTDMSAALRTQFARRQGYSTFLSGSYYNRPAEVWAYNQARCHGYAQQVRFRYVACSVISDFEKKAAQT